MKKKLAVLFASWIHQSPARKHRHKGQQIKLHKYTGSKMRKLKMILLESQGSKQPNKEGLVQTCREKKGYKKAGWTGAAKEGKDILKINRRNMVLE